MAVLLKRILLGESGSTVTGFVFHFDEVCKVAPEKATVIARSTDCDILAFKLNAYSVWGVQPHFEIGIVEGIQIIDRAVGDDVPAKQYFLDGAENPPRDSGQIMPLMKAFHQSGPL